LAAGEVVLAERFPAKWIPVRLKKTRQNRKLERRSDSIGTALEVQRAFKAMRKTQPAARM
jgi:hypothetical protein